MVHASSTVGCVLAGVFELRAGEWVDVVGGCGVDVGGISAEVVEDKLVVVVDVSFVNIRPNTNNNVVKFVRVTGVGVNGLSIRSGLGAFKCGNWFGSVLLKCPTYGSGTSAKVVKPSFSKVELVLDFEAGVVMVFSEEVFHVQSDVGNDGAGVNVFGADELGKLAFLLVAVIQVVKYVCNCFTVELCTNLVK